MSTFGVLIKGSLSASLIMTLLLTTKTFAAGVVRSPQSAVPTEAQEALSPTTQAPSNFVDAKANNAPGKMTSLGEITTEVEGDLTIVTARLNKVPEWKDVILEEHGTFLQIKLSNTMIPASGEFIDGNGPFLKKIATFQLPNEDGALRLFVNQDAAKAKLASTAELIGNRLIITIDHNKLEQLISVQPAKSAGETASDIVAKTQVDKNLAAPGDLIAGAVAEKASAGATLQSPAGGELRSQLTKAAGFFAVLLLALVASQVVRAKRRKSGKFDFNRSISEPTAMKVLSSISVGQKQKVTLIQVGHQEILIGVGPETVNLITIIESTPKVNQFARHLESANPNADIRLKSPNEATPPLQARRPVAASTTTRPSTQPSATSTVKGNRINVGVGDEGPKNLNSPTNQKNDDITRILRDRLRNIPPG